jgi:hypothetical protein
MFMVIIFRSMPYYTLHLQTRLYLRLQVLKAASMKMIVFWDVAPLTDVSEVFTTSIIRAS